MLELEPLITFMGEPGLTWPGVDAGKAFLYLFRRFGPPEHGSDPRKEVCIYVLPTAISGLCLTILIGGRTAYIQDWATRTVWNTYYQAAPRTGGDGKFCQQCEQVFTDTLRELLRPVRVRDLYINLVGEVAVAELGPWSDTAKRFTNEVEPFTDAGHGYTYLAALGRYRRFQRARQALRSYRNATANTLTA